MNALESFERKLQQDLGAVVIGMEPVIRALAIAVVARGHVLLQGAPGLGKTLLSKSLAGALGGVFKRVQGTADLMPSDITGVHVFDTERRDFVFRPGPVFADVLLVDEINRTGPEDAVGAAGGDGGAAGHDRPAELSLAGEIPGHRHPESARVRRHVSSARIAARPLHAAYRPHISGDEQHELEILAKYGNADAHAGQHEPEAASAAVAAAQAAVESVHVAPGAQRIRSRYRGSVA